VKKTLAVLGLALAAAAAVAAVDVQLKDGTVIAAESYKVTGSFVMVQLPNGSQMAYDVADVDLAALRADEAARAAASGAPAETEQGRAGDAISSGRGLKSAAEAADDSKAGLAITDRDVKHVHGSGVQGDEEQEEATSNAAGGVPEGYQQGGGVVLNNIRVEAAGEGQWRVSGEVINRNPQPALNVVVKLETMAAAGGEKWSGEVAVSSFLAPDDKAAFEHGFAAEIGEGKAQPDVRATVIWMQQETRREPDYTKAGGVPHPSNLPLQHGGVTGADVRPTPIQ
jgi:hypothetical protein